MIAALVVSSPTLSPSTASAEPRVTSTPAVELEWPTQLHFRISAESDVAITEVTLRYTLRDTGFSAFSRPRDFTPGTSVNVTVSIDVNTSAGYVPVGNTFDYVWEITDASGAVFTSQPQSYLFLPPDGEWTSITSELMVVHHLRGEESLARRFLDAAVQTNADMGTLLGATLPHTPVVAVLFEDRAAMDVATTGSRVRETACGVRVSDTTIFLSPEPCGTFDETDTLRHEFTHLLVSAAAGPAAIPLWLNEGTAVTGQVAADRAYTGPFEQAVRTNRLYTFLEMQRSQNPSTRVELFYGQ
ncbi:MAG TPA: hypothetical protein VFK32_09490, partial [Tepidiformaceae bacterium]|nr:hypothetical protein [Tepidiformaceae bacterium]